MSVRLHRFSLSFGRSGEPFYFNGIAGDAAAVDGTVTFENYAVADGGTIPMQYWVTLPVGTDMLPLLVHACSRCDEALVEGAGEAAGDGGDEGDEGEGDDEAGGGDDESERRTKIVELELLCENGGTCFATYDLDEVSAARRGGDIPLDSVGSSTD